MDCTCLLQNMIRCPHFRNAADGAVCKISGNRLGSMNQGNVRLRLCVGRRHEICEYYRLSLRDTGLNQWVTRLQFRTVPVAARYNGEPDGS